MDCQDKMSLVISASRRTDLPAGFPDLLASFLREGRARGAGPTGRPFEVDISPSRIHTLVLWSKDYSRVIGNAFGLRGLLARYEQLYIHFTLTGLGGTLIEERVPVSGTALDQIPEIVRIAGSPERVSLRFDPVVFWKEKGRIRNNLFFFDRLAPKARAEGIRDIRLSFAQPYGKALRRFDRRGLVLMNREDAEKRSVAADLACMARAHGLILHACSQDFLSGIEGIVPSSCIDGRKLTELHPRREQASLKKDRTQRSGCLCTESRDIGSYHPPCPHGCLYCYANSGK